MVTTVGCDSGSDIESSGGVVVPGFACVGGFVHITELSDREYGVGSEVEWEVVEAVVCTLSRVRVPGL